MNRVIALAWAVEPLAFNDCLPPQSTLAEPAYGGGGLLLLLHAETSRAAAASRLSAAPDRLSFT
jgi:hypothetical protein